MMHTLAAEARVHLAADATVQVAAGLPQFSSVTNFVVSTVAAVFTAILVVKVAKHWAKSDWGALVVEVIAAVICAWIVLTPDKAIAAFQAVSNSF